MQNLNIRILFIDLPKCMIIKPLIGFVKHDNVHLSTKHFCTAVKNLYHISMSKVKIRNKFSRILNISKGLHQGCCISLSLFKIYVEEVLLKWQQKCSGMGIP